MKLPKGMSLRNVSTPDDFARGVMCFEVTVTIPQPPHPLVSVDGIGEPRWSVCGCGWVSAVVADRRSAVQAHEEHEREQR